MTIPPPRWAIRCAWLVPLTILPSAVWRVSLLFRDGTAGWYLVLLSVLSLGFGLLTVGLVRPWGEAVPVRLATGAAFTGAILQILFMLYGTWNSVFGNLFDFAPALGYGQEAFAEPGPLVDILYAPMFAWGPLLIAVTIDYRRRRYDARREVGWGGGRDEVWGTGATADRRC